LNCLVVDVESDRLQDVQRPSACAAMTSSLLNLVFPTRFFSLSLFLLLDNPQPRKPYGEDHHNDENGVFYHRNCLSYFNQ